jgi:hypothetical protein
VEALPSLTESVMLCVSPTSPVAGVPESAPLVALNVSQAGLFVMLKVIASPFASLDDGVNEYGVLTAAVVAGVPLMVGAALPPAAPPVPGVDMSPPPPPQAETSKAAASAKAAGNRTSLRGKRRQSEFMDCFRFT